MYIGNYADITPSEYLWGIQFFPALIVDGESVVDGTFGMGIQPRASFGQATNGDVLMLVIDGRQAGYSLGCTVAECTKILLSYDCYQAMNLDGGSSALLWYDGENMTSPSSVSSDGRLLPNCFVVYPASEVDD
jgi:exopolysaccharide biosynthesis protein